MSILKRSLSLVLIAALALCLVACGSDIEWRQPYEEPVVEVFVDTDGQFEYQTVDWAGPEGYVIVIPKGDKQAEKSAKYLQTFFSSAYELEVEIVTDETAETAKEILIGKTNRADSAAEIAEKDLEVKVSGEKLVFLGGHYVTVNSAVEKFVRLAPEKGKANTYKVTTDFVSTALDGYEYVWGDEFEGDGLNYTKWDTEARMGGTTLTTISRDEDVIDVDDGRLKLHVQRIFDPEQEGMQYKVPFSVLTKYKMNHVYGYVEMRARVPYYLGCWPSWWGSNAPSVDATKVNYTVEVDIFEVFGDTKVVPNIHKWYTSNYNYDYYHHPDHSGDINAFGSNHTLHSSILPEERLVYDWAEKGKTAEQVSEEYHIYGFEWTPTEMSMYVDGTKYMTYSITKSFDKNADMSGFHKPMFWMFNNHTIDSAPEHVLAASAAEGFDIKNSLPNLPACYYIDYMRVYQKPDQKGGMLYVDETIIDYTNTETDNILKKIGE